MGKVRFGLSNVRYSVYDAETKTYGDVKRAKGGVSLSLDAEGDTSTFYADNTTYATFSTNNGYSGTLELAAAEDEMLKDLLGFEDDGGILLEFSDAKQATFALMFEVDGNEVPQRTCIYGCTLSRPGVNANTKQESTDPDTQTFNFKSIGTDVTFKGVERHLARATVENTTANAAKYKTFFDKVPTPTEAAA